MRLKTPKEIHSTLMRDFEIEKTLRRLSGSANYSILDIPQSTKEEVGRHMTHFDPKAFRGIMTKPTNAGIT